jgi:hypothetical protein
LEKVRAVDDKAPAVLATSSEEVAVETGSSQSSAYGEPIPHQETSKNAYLHPAFYKPAPQLWLPRDANGTAEAQVDVINQIEGLSATMEGATLVDGKIAIDPDHLPANL